jgi:uncharacterized RDD family membrane protein YckC
MKERKMVVGFWLRLLADVMDALILGLAGFLLAIPFKEQFYRLGENGLFIGLLITFAYTGLLQSHIGQGQSLAKKALRIQVLNMDGTYQSLFKSFMRYAVIALIFYNSWIYMALSSLFPFLNNEILQSGYTYFVIFLLLGVTILVAFHPLKRGIHDLLANSIVVRKGTFDPEKVARLNIKSKARRSFFIWGSCCLILAGLSVYLLAWQKKMTPTLAELTKIQQDLSASTAFENISVRYNTHHGKNAEGIETTRASLSILPFLRKEQFDNPDLRMRETQKAVAIALMSSAMVDRCDFISVQIRTGFNIGISSLYIRQTTTFDTDGNPMQEQKKASTVEL